MFHATGLFLYPLKTLENQMLSDVFRVYRKKPKRELIRLSKTKQKEQQQQKYKLHYFYEHILKKWIEFQSNIFSLQSWRMQDHKTMKRNKISTRYKSTEWESMKAVPKVSNVSGIDLPEAAIGSVLKNFAKFTGNQSLFLIKFFFTDIL